MSYVYVWWALKPSSLSLKVKRNNKYACCDAYKMLTKTYLAFRYYEKVITFTIYCKYKLNFFIHTVEEVHSLPFEDALQC